MVVGLLWLAGHGDRQTPTCLVIPQIGLVHATNDSSRSVTGDVARQAARTLEVNQRLTVQGSCRAGMTWPRTLDMYSNANG
jgi:hypothetical protein